MPIPLPEKYQGSVVIISGVEYPLNETWPKLTDSVRAHLLRQFDQRQMIGPFRLYLRSLGDCA